MSDEAKRYNGWSNYETWCVHLWLTNDEGSYRYWREEAARHRKESGKDAAGPLAEQLKATFETFHPFRGEHLAKPNEPDVYCDLLDAALSEVDWHEIAEAFLADVEPAESTEDAGADEDDEEAYSAEEFEQLKRERIENQKEPLFELGEVMSTPGALQALTREDIGRALARHHRGDWGDVGRHDWRENETGLRDGFRLLSAYNAADGTKFWVITEADRSVTTVLLPDEY